MCRDCGQDSEIEHVRTFSNSHQAQRGRFQSIEDSPHFDQVGAACIGEDDSLPDPLEQ